MKTEKTKLRLADIPRVVGSGAKPSAHAEEKAYSGKRETPLPEPWTLEERRLHKEYFDALFWYEPTSKEDGERWLQEFCSLMGDIADDAQAYHQSKIKTAEAAKKLKVRLEELRQKQKAK